MIVLEVWLDVEHALMQTAIEHEITARQPTMKVIREMERRGIISHDLGSLIRDLRGVRNNAVHSVDFDLTRESAIHYAHRGPNRGFPSSGSQTTLIVAALPRP